MLGLGPGLSAIACRRGMTLNSSTKAWYCEFEMLHEIKEFKWALVECHEEEHNHVLSTLRVLPHSYQTL